MKSLQMSAVDVELAQWITGEEDLQLEARDPIDINDGHFRLPHKKHFGAHLCHHLVSLSHVKDLVVKALELHSVLLLHPILKLDVEADPGLGLGRSVHGS